MLSVVKRIVTAGLCVWALGGCDAPQLKPGHDGWMHPDCTASGCHNGKGHREDKKPHQCAGCHGENGAPDRPHESRDECLECHEAEALAHGDPDRFPSPKSCNRCH